MPRIIPPTKAQVDSSDQQTWSNFFRPDWESLIACERVDGVAVLNATWFVESLKNNAGEVLMLSTPPGLNPYQVTLPQPDDLGELFLYSDEAPDNGAEWTVTGRGTDGRFKTVDVTLGPTPVSLGGEWSDIYFARVTSPTPNFGSVYVSDVSGGEPVWGTDNVYAVARPGSGIGWAGLLKSPESGMFMFTDLNVYCPNGSAIVRAYSQREGDGPNLAAQWVVDDRDSTNISLRIPYCWQDGDVVYLTAERFSGNNLDVLVTARGYTMGDQNLVSSFRAQSTDLIAPDTVDNRIGGPTLWER